MTARPAIQYDFVAPPKIVFGWGRRAELGALARGFGRRCFVVWGSRTLAGSDVAGELFQTLREAGVEATPLATITHEPEVQDVDAAVRRLLDEQAGTGEIGLVQSGGGQVGKGVVILAVGGGSAIDLAKAVAALATNRAPSVVDFLEGVGRGLAITQPPLPFVAVPTTSGTGSEATKNAVISSYDPPFKKSLRSEMMLPRAVLVDPELTVSLPASVTAQSGLDAVTQLIESYISCRARPIPQALAIDGLRLAVPALTDALQRPADRQAREAMAHAALLSGLALANSGLGMAHGVAAALGVHARVSHGLACGFMLPIALRANRMVAGARYAEMAAALGLPPGGSAADAFVHRIELLCRDVGLPSRLTDLGVRRQQIPHIVRSSRGNSMDGNPRVVTDEELTALLEDVL
jgi:alcohol dehydrogenase class IV